MDEDEVGPLGATIEELITLIELQQGLLSSVATGGPRIEAVERTYKTRRDRIRRGLRPYGIPEPFPWGSLWDWYGFWQSLGGYALRRRHVEGLAGPVLDQLRERHEAIGLSDWADGGIESLQARLEGIKLTLQSAASLDDYQDVGRRCREVLSDLSDEVFDPSLVPDGQPSPVAKDVKARLDLFFAARFAGESGEEMRRLMRATVALANATTHSDSASAVTSYAVAQATILVVRVAETLTAQPGIAKSDDWLF
jgi:hypothetical protein